MKQRHGPAAAAIVESQLLLPAPSKPKLYLFPHTHATARDAENLADALFKLRRDTGKFNIGREAINSPTTREFYNNIATASDADLKKHANSFIFPEFSYRFSLALRLFARDGARIFPIDVPSGTRESAYQDQLDSRIDWLTRQRRHKIPLSREYISLSIAALKTRVQINNLREAYMVKTIRENQLLSPDPMAIAVGSSHERGIRLRTKDITMTVIGIPDHRSITSVEEFGYYLHNRAYERLSTDMALHLVLSPETRKAIIYSFIFNDMVRAAERTRRGLKLIINPYGL